MVWAYSYTPLQMVVQRAICVSPEDDKQLPAQRVAAQRNEIGRGLPLLSNSSNISADKGGLNQ